MPDTLNVSECRDVLTLRLNRPEVLNALNHSAIMRLDQVLLEARSRSSLRGVVITGAGGAFCAGDDLNELTELGAEGFERQIAGLQSLTRRIRELDVPVVAAIDGAAMGGGLELALSCDARVASESAIFACPEPAWGLTPTNGSSVLLTQLIGDGRARELLMFGRSIDAQEALRIGLVTRLADGQSAYDVATEMLEHASDFAPRALTLTKQLLNRGDSTLVETLEAEAAAVSTAFEDDSTRTRLSSFSDGSWRRKSRS